MTLRHNAQHVTPNRQLQFDWSARNRNDNERLAKPQADKNASPESEVERTTRSMSGTHYEPGHPWHYLKAGDHAAPIPFDDIPPAEDYDRSLERELPRPTARRLIKAQEILAAERRDLEQARHRYENVLARGADALSRYDREIAYGGNDELARAGTLALMFNQIAWRRGRIAYLEQIQGPQMSRRR